MFVLVENPCNNILEAPYVIVVVGGQIQTYSGKLRGLWIKSVFWGTYLTIPKPVQYQKRQKQSVGHTGLPNLPNNLVHPYSDRSGGSDRHFDAPHTHVSDYANSERTKSEHTVVQIIRRQTGLCKSYQL